MRENEFFDTICNTEDGVYIVDSNKHIVRWNKGAERILKYPESDVLDQVCHRVISGKTSSDKPHCSQDCKIHAGALKGSPQRNFDLRTRANNGELLWLNVTIVASTGGEDSFVAHLIRDITPEKKAGLALNHFLADLGAQTLIPAEDSAGQPTNLHPTEAGRSASEMPSVSLSNRELEVLTLLAEGLSTKSLAKQLGISHFTARNHIQNILVKLDLHSKAQAVAYAFRKGIL